MQTIKSILCLAVFGVLAGCVSPPQAEETPEPTRAPATPTLPPPAIRTAPTATGGPTRSPPPSPFPATPFPPVIPEGVFPFIPPIQPPGRDTVDSSYRFGTTQNGLREPHHGVEFLNSQGTPVSAAADGVVVFAGDDYNGSPYSPKGGYAFYGLFVVVKHMTLDYPEPAYTLYAHLSEILVQTGDVVRVEQEIGLVGFTGAATGSHLHFEVRYGGTAYVDARNPEIWLSPLPGNGALAGSIVDKSGLPLPVFPLQLTPLGDIGYTQYFSSYEESALRDQPPLFENFAIGNLPAGTYELTFIAYTLERHVVEIRAGELTFLKITIDDSE